MSRYIINEIIPSFNKIITCGLIIVFCDSEKTLSGVL